MIIIGSKGHAKEILNVLSYNDDSSLVHFFDNVTPSKEPMLYGKFPIIRRDIGLINYFKKKDVRFILGIGNPLIRKKLMDFAIELGGQLHSVISNNAIIGRYDTNIGNGVNIMHGVIINNSVSIGTGCLINANTTIHHDCHIGDFCEVSPNVSITGRVKVGNFCSIGTGAIILPDVEIGNNAIIGAGAVVTKHVKSFEKIIGIPGKPI